MRPSEPESRFPPRGRIVYIAGVGRSGSTLLGELLAKAPGVVHLGELRFVFSRGIVDNDLCGCGEAFGDCVFWRPIAGQLVRDRPPEDIERRLGRASRIRIAVGLLASPKQSLSRIAAQGDLNELDHAYRAVQRACGEGTVVDSSKSVPYLILLLLATDRDVSVVHIVRDPRSVAMSRSRLRARTEVVGGNAFMTRQSAASSAVSWILGNGLMELTRIRLRTPYCRVRYEDVVADPDAAIRDIAKALGIEATVGNIVSESGAVSLQTSHTVAGNPMRFHSGEVKIQPDISWRGRLTRLQAATVSLITLPLMIAYGYLWRRTSQHPR